MSASSLSHFRHYSKSVGVKLLKVLNAMPKEPKHIAEAQKQRRKIKEKCSKYSPGKVTLQVLGSGAEGAPKSLYVFSDQSRYLFNCGEGTQRLAHEHKMKLAKLEHVFVTQPVWDKIGGLPGAALTIQDVGVPHITLHGPQGLEEIFVATRRFVVIKDLEIRVADCSETAVFEDNVLKIRYVPIRRGSPIEERTPSPVTEDDDTDYYAHEHSGRRTKPEKISEQSQKLLHETKGVSMAFVCQLQPRPGALCLDKCVKFGIPPGPLLGKLKSGQDVILPNGNVVKTADVCDPDDPGPVFIVVDCPTEDYIESLLSNETFKKHQSTATNDEDLTFTVVHFSPQTVIDHPKYRQWIDLFSPSTHHLIINESNSCMGSAAVHRIQHKLNLISNDIFPILGDRGTEVSNEELATTPPLKKSKSVLPIAEVSPTSRPCSPNSSYIYPNTLYNHHLRPKKGSDKTLELKLSPAQFIEETMAIEDFPRVLHEVTQQLGQRQRDLPIREYPKLVFLGTGSSIPNKTRNTSGILLRIDEERSIVIDCGEGTYGQIVRFYGQNQANEVMSTVKAIYISHLHADHHLGLIGLLQGRRRALQNKGLEHKPLLLIAPKQISWWLSFYDKCFEGIQHEYELIPNAELLQNDHDLAVETETKLLDTLDMSEVSTCFVRHCPNAFGVTFVQRNGTKITYSGDTLPSDHLVKLGKDSDVLIHEATMEDELAAEAVIKMHSTTSQAIDIGKKMNAKFTLLTHFSQRYAKLPRFNDNFSENVGIAFDNMQVRIDELPLLPFLYPALKLMFAEHVEELEHKAAKRQLKIEREKECLKQS